MIKNYFKVACRNLLRNKGYTIINIGGLTLGFCCFLLLNFYVSSEKNFDSASTDVYRLLQKEQKDGKIRQIAAIPSQTAAASFKWWNEFMQTNWQRNAAVTYFKLKPHTKRGPLENKITHLAKENWPKEIAFQSNFILQPVQDIHLYQAEVQGEINKSKGNAFYVNIFFWIAIVVLLVACFNYIGLLNVSFMNRAKEIGVRKVIGAGRSQLLWQFFTESFLLTSIALLLSICILQFSRHFITELLGTSFDWTYLPTGKIIMLIACGLCITLISIAYPTYIIVRISPVRALKERLKRSQTFSLQKAVLTFQFLAAITLITCTFLFYRQVKYMEHKDLGFHSEGIVVVDINSGTLRNKFEVIKTDFNRLIGSRVWYALRKKATDVLKAN